MLIKISLSILEYEKELVKHMDDLPNSEAFSRISSLIETRELHSLHVDIMRPPFIQDRTAFPDTLVQRIYELLAERIPIDFHLMVKDPNPMIRKMSDFINSAHTPIGSIIIHREAFDSMNDVLNTMRGIRKIGCRASIAIDLRTPLSTLTDGMVELADMVLIMAVPMGKGAQRYHDMASEKIRRFKEKYPKKIVKVDGGINNITILDAVKAGAEIITVGSYITASEDPLEALMRLKMALYIS